MPRLAPLLLSFALLCGLAFTPAQATESDSLTFTVEVRSSLAQGPVTVTTWMQDGMLRTESVSGQDRTTTIVRDGKTYLLEPALELAQVTPLRSASELPEAQRKYWGLVDPLQVAPTHLPALFRELGARSLGSDKMDGVEVEALALTLPADLKFPIDNPRLYVRTSDGLPYRLDYRRNREETVEVRFLDITTNAQIAAERFMVPATYRLVEYEW